MIAEFRLQSVLIREFSRKEVEHKVIIGTALCINTFFALVGMLVIYFVAYFESQETLKIGLILYSSIFIYKIPRLFRSLFVASERNILIVKSEICSSLLTFSMIAYVLVCELSFNMFLFVRTVDFLLLACFFILMYNHFQANSVGLSFCKNTCKKLILSSAPLVLSGAAMMLFQRVDIIFIRQYLGEYPAGIYSSATNIMMLFSLAPMVLSESLAPKLFCHKITDEKFHNAKHKFALIIISVGLILSILQAISSYYFLFFLYGDTYLLAHQSLLIMSFTPMLLSLGSVAGQIIVAENIQKWSYIKSIVGCLVTILSIVILVPIYGIEGAAASTVLGLLFSNVICHYFIPSYSDIFKLQVSSILKIFKLPINKLSL